MWHRVAGSRKCDIIAEMGLIRGSQDKDWLTTSTDVGISIVFKSLSANAHSAIRGNFEFDSNVIDDFIYISDFMLPRHSATLLQTYHTILQTMTDLHSRLNSLSIIPRQKVACDFHLDDIVLISPHSVKCHGCFSFSSSSSAPSTAPPHHRRQRVRPHGTDTPTP
jgi:hypothetical protein